MPVIQISTDRNGHYRVTHVPAGVYDATLRVDGIEADRKIGVTTHEDATTDLNFILQRTVLADPGATRYPVVHDVIVGRKASGEQTQGTFIVQGLTVVYSDTGSSAHGFTVSCHDFLVRDSWTAKDLHVGDRHFEDHFSAKHISSTVFPSPKQVYDGSRKNAAPP